MSDGKTLNDYFSDWEGHVFGFGYGSGEEHVIDALCEFMSLRTVDAGTYDYEILEKKLGPKVAWLMINALCHARILEYGTSPRFGWLSWQGMALKKFLASRPFPILIELACRDENYTRCYPDACNCGPDGYDPRRRCANPFWVNQP